MIELKQSGMLLFLIVLFIVTVIFILITELKIRRKKRHNSRIINAPKFDNKPNQEMPRKQPDKIPAKKISTEKVESQPLSDTRKDEENKLSSSNYTIDAKFDDDQKSVIKVDSGYCLVLAPAGCGKTDILAERIARALHRGVKLDDMLCLTFTNRAARGMFERIEKRLGFKIKGNLFVGNVHKFCSEFLFSQNIIPQNATILDETEVIYIIQNLMQQKEEIIDEYNLKEEFLKISKMQHYIHQIEHNHPNEVFLNQDIIDVDLLEKLCEKIHVNFSANKGSINSDLLKDLYYKIEEVLSPKSLETYLRNTLNDLESRFSKALCSNDAVSIHRLYKQIEGLSRIVLPYDCYHFAKQILYAKKYNDYKRDNNILDFDDLLLIAYDYATENPQNIHKYSWIQIDEVQDLNPMQFAIVDAFTADISDSVVVYLGDEKQAIFSFIGAKLSTLEWLKERCKGNILHLSKNYRSPKYLLDVFNKYAHYHLGVDIDFGLFCDSKDNKKASVGDLVIKSALNLNDEAKLAASLAKDLTEKDSINGGNADTTTAIIVPYNKHADLISKELEKLGVSHFKISGKDVFQNPSIQTLFAHFSVVNYETNFIAWSRLFRNLKLFNQYANSRRFFLKMKEAYFTPSDALNYSGSSCLIEFSKAYDKEIVVFDTETTGLSIFNDDIVQIAASKIRKGQIIDTINIFLETKKTIPETLGSVPNPLLEVYPKQDKLSRENGLKKFLEFAKGSVLLGHNIEYDYHILDNNLKRDCRISDFNKLFPEYYDSLKLTRILEPNLKVYKLGKLKEIFNLSGTNSHLADEDVALTVELTKHLYQKFQSNIVKHTDFINNHLKLLCEFRTKYANIYRHTMRMMYEQKIYEGSSSLVEEMKYVYNFLTTNDYAQEEPKIEYFYNYLNIDVIDQQIESSLYEQLNNHIMDINSFKEADLCGSKSMTEKIFLSTVHKAKGLEFTNVIVFEAKKGIYPNCKSQDGTQERKEDARKFYVAISRAKKRLYIIYSTTFSGDVNKNSFEKGITSFMSGIIGDFEDEEFVEDPIWIWSMKQKDINHYFHRDEGCWY